MGLESLQGRVALITGSGHGIGRATALLLAQQGVVVAVNDLKQSFVDETISLVTEAGGNAVGIVQDISSREGMKSAVSQVMTLCGRLDIMVNNAAWVRYQAVTDISDEVVDRMLNVGFKSVVWGIQAAAEVMSDKNGGCIVNIASVAGLRSAPKSIVYSGIKAGIMGITRAAAAELGDRGIRVNAIAPGAVPTEGTLKHRSPELDAKRVARTPMGRLGTVEDVAGVVLMLVSDSSRFVTAEVISVDGGMSQTTL